jgi:NADPH:quinone reductase-like Zn-dependent oxidoreductase
VIATASSAKSDYVKKLGADVVIDYKEQFCGSDSRSYPIGIDVVLIQ